MSMKTVPTPPVIDTHADFYTVRPYPLRYTVSTAMMCAAFDWDALPWWRRALARWASGRDWGVACAGWAKLAVTDDDLTVCAMVDREEFIARWGEG